MRSFRNAGRSSGFLSKIRSRIGDLLGYSGDATSPQITSKTPLRRSARSRRKAERKSRRSRFHLDRQANWLHLQPLEQRTLLTVQVSVNAVDKSASEAGPDTGQFEFTRSGGSNAAPLTVNIEVKGSATQNVDYFGLSGSTIVIPAGSDTYTSTIVPVDDLLKESTEYVIVQILDGTGYDHASPDDAGISITDNDANAPGNGSGVMPIVTITASDPNAAELNVDPGTFVISRTGPVDYALAVSYVLSGTAINGTDYNTITLGIVIPVGASSVNLVVTPIDDTLAEGSESVVCSLTSDSSYMVGAPSAAAVTIADNDSQGGSGAIVTLVADDPLASEKNLDKGRFSFSRTGVMNNALTVFYSIGGTATNGADYSSIGGSITFPAFVSVVTLDINPLQDYLTEGSETVILSLTANSNYVVGVPSTGVVTISDNDPCVMLSADPLYVKEPKSGSTAVKVTLTLEYATDWQIDVNWATAPDTATANLDYASASGVVSFLAGQTTASFDVLIHSDAIAELDERFYINLTGPTGLCVDAQGSVIIQDTSVFTGGKPISTNMPITLANPGMDPLTGEYTRYIPTSDPSHNLIYQSFSNERPAIAVQSALGNVGTPTALSAQLTINGVTSPAVWYSPAPPGQDMRFVLQPNVDMPTGHLPWSVILTATIGGVNYSREFTGFSDTINRNDSEFGRRVRVSEVCRAFQADGGVLIARGDGIGLFYADDGAGGYLRPKGDPEMSTLTKSGGSWTLTNEWGDKYAFGPDGMETSFTDSNGNVTSYQYLDKDGDSVVDELWKITDPAGKVWTCGYSGPNVDYIDDGFGRRTDLTITNGKLTQLSLPDPDSNGPLLPPTWNFTYDVNTQLISQTVDPESNTWGCSFDFAGRIDAVTNPDATIDLLDPQETRGLVNTSTGVGSFANPAPWADPLDVNAFRRDTLGHDWIYVTDRFGLPLSQKDPVLNVTLWERDSNGRATKLTLPDPDGPSYPVQSQIFTFVHDGMENVTSATAPDGSTETWTFDSIFNRPTSYTDQIARKEIYTIDGFGNMTGLRKVQGAQVDPAGGENDDIVWTFTYTTSGVKGLLDVVTDPLGHTTDYDYNSHGLPIKVTYPTVGAAAFETFEYNTFDDMTASNNELTWKTQYEYDNLHRLITLTEADPDGPGVGQPLTSPITRFEYDRLDRPTKQTDSLGRITTWAYPNSGRQFVTNRPDHDNNGQPTTTTIYFDPLGRITQVTDPLNRTVTNTYDLAGNLVTTTYPDPDLGGPQVSPVVTRTYDNVHRMLSQTDPDPDNGGPLPSPVTNFTWSNRDWVTTVTAPDSDGSGPAPRGVTTIARDLAGQTTTVTDAAGRVTTSTWDGAGRLTSVRLPNPTDGTGTGGPLTQFSYDKDSNTRFVTDPLGNQTEYVFDARDRLTDVYRADPDGVGPATRPHYVFAYSVANELLSMTDPQSHITSSAYDRLSRRTSLTTPDPDGAGPMNAPIRYYFFDAYSNLIQTKDPDPDGMGPFPPADTFWTYDALNHVKTITKQDPDGNGSQTAPVTSYTWSGDDELTGVVDPLARTTGFTFDQLGRLTQTTDTLNHTTTRTYDGLSRLSTVTDFQNHVTSFGYDGLSRRVSTTDALGGITTAAYDLVGNVTSITDPTNNTSNFTYDKLDRVLTDTNSLSAVRSYEYDLDSRLTKVTDRNNKVREFAYDNLSRPTSETWKTSGTAVRQILPAWNAIDNLTSIYDTNGVNNNVLDSKYTYSYDGLDRVTQVDSAGTPGIPSVQLAATFDTANRRLTLSATKGGQLDFKNTYVYDYLNRLIREDQTQQTGGATVAQKRVDFAYNAIDEFVTIARYKNTAGGTSNEVATSNYGYDTAGRITSLNHKKGTNTKNAYTFTYDTLDRLSQTTSNDGTTNFSYDSTSQVTTVDLPGTTNDENWTYDLNGNRTNTGYTTTTNNRLTSDGVFNYTYDAEGNRITRTRISSAAADDYLTEYTWDHRNRLTNMTFKNNSGVVKKTVDYGYDVFDRRIKKVVDNDGPGSGAPITSRFVYDGSDIVLQFDGANNLTHRYLHGPAVDQILADEQINGGTSTLYWPLADQQGTIRDVVNNSGTVVNHLQYSSFGKVTSETNAAIDLIYGYTGRERDEETGMNYFRARYQDPSTGRFISEDPLGFGAGDANVSRYVGNNSPNSTDPSGLESFPAAHRGEWVVGEKGDGTWEYSNSKENRAAGLAGKRIRFVDNKVDVGGFPPEAYWKGDATKASVEIDTITGQDAKAADRAMREQLGDKEWKRPKGYRWHHAGGTGSHTMELVKKKYHGAVHHEGTGAEPRRIARANAQKLADEIPAAGVAKKVLKVLGILGLAKYLFDLGVSDLEAGELRDLTHKCIQAKRENTIEVFIMVDLNEFLEEYIDDDRTRYVVCLEVNKEVQRRRSLGLDPFGDGGEEADEIPGLEGEIDVDAEYDQAVYRIFQIYYSHYDYDFINPQGVADMMTTADRMQPNYPKINMRAMMDSIVQKQRSEFARMQYKEWKDKHADE